MSSEKPEKGIIFIKQKINKIKFDQKYDTYDETSDYLSFDYSFNKYYIQENIAVKAENYLRDHSKDTETTFYITLKVNENGEYSVGNLKINDKKVEDLFNN